MISLQTPPNHLHKKEHFCVHQTRIRERRLLFNFFKRSPMSLSKQPPLTQMEPFKRSKLTIYNYLLNRKTSSSLQLL
uniref:Putative ovule protein n=1 Tax=Solanum chacoense TaxID=4108 RepID=A0A0V0H1G8_SOLCH